MREIMIDLERTVLSSDGDEYYGQVAGDQRPDGMWEAWIEFRPLDEGPTRATDRETTQPNRQAVEYWMSGLEPIYFEGAFARAVELPV